MADTLTIIYVILIGMGVGITTSIILVILKRRVAFVLRTQVLSKSKVRPDYSDLSLVYEDPNGPKHDPVDPFLEYLAPDESPQDTLESRLDFLENLVKDQKKALVGLESQLSSKELSADQEIQSEIDRIIALLQEADDPAEIEKLSDALAKLRETEKVSGRLPLRFDMLSIFSSIFTALVTLASAILAFVYLG